MNKQKSQNTTATIPASYFEARDCELLNLRRIPAIVNRAQTAALLGVPAEGIGLLVDAKLLKPLAVPGQGAPFLFMRDQILELANAAQKLMKIKISLERGGPS